MSLSERDQAIEKLLPWLHESSLNRCDMGSDTCETRDVAAEIVDLVLPLMLPAHHEEAVDALKLIACARASCAQHAIDVGLARNALEAMGVNPSLWRKR